MGGGCCCPASLHSSDFFVPASGGQIPQELSDAACGRIKAASFPGFMSDVWILWHKDKVRIFHQLYVFICVMSLFGFSRVCLWLGVSTLPSAWGSLIYFYETCLFLWNLDLGMFYLFRPWREVTIGFKLFGMKTHRLPLHEQARSNLSNHFSVSQLSAYLPTGARTRFMTVIFLPPLTIWMHVVGNAQ